MTHYFTAAALIVMMAASVAVAHAAAPGPNAYPTKPVRVIVGLAPGGATDIQARVFARSLSEDLGRPFIIDNRSGAGGLIGVETVAKANPDGYTLLAATPSFTIAPAFYDKPPYNPRRDFAPISLVTKAPFLVVVHPSLAAKSVSELIALAKASPTPLNFGTGGLGTTIHLGLAWISNVANGKITIIPYKGTAPALADVLAGQLHGTFANVISVLPHVKSERVRAIAVTSMQRSRVLPDVPTVAESGVPGFDVTTWHGWLAPRGTPSAIVNKLSAGLAKIVRSPEAMEKFAADGGEPVASTPAEFDQFIGAEIGRWTKLVKATGIRVTQ